MENEYTVGKALVFLPVNIRQRKKKKRSSLSNVKIMSVWADFGCVGGGKTNSHTHSYIHSDKDAFVPHTYIYEHEVRRRNQPPLEVRCYNVTVCQD